MEVVNKGLPAKCCGGGVEERQVIKAAAEIWRPTGPDAVGFPLLADGSYQIVLVTCTFLFTIWWVWR